MTRSRAYEVMNDVKGYLQDESLNQILVHLTARLTFLGESEGNIAAYKDMLRVIQNPFDSIDTVYLMFRYLEKDLGLYFPPEEIIIDKKYVVENQNDGDTKEPDDVSFQFLPLRKVLQQFFEILGILQSTISNVTRLEQETTLLDNVVQTELWKQKKSSSGDRLVLPLLLYHDDYETNNPLGSHKGLGKVGAVYCFPACLPPQIKSKVENIFLLTLYNTKDIDRVPHHMIFSKAVEELKYLEMTGITITTENGPLDIYFSLVSVIGDNLGVNFMLGFSTGFIANHPCRFCKIHFNDMGSVLHESKCIMKTDENYQTDLLHDNLSQTGIKKQSVLRDLNSSSTISLMAVDIMHDINEGVFEYDVGSIISHFLQDSDIPIDLAELNSRIKKFYYGDESNTPRTILNSQIKNKRIKMSANEAGCLIKNIGMLLGDIIPHENEYWQVIILLKEIYDIITAPAVTNDIIDFLSTLITDYLEKLVKLFGDCLKPKHHNLIHYPTVMRRVGPLSHLSTIRCESKNCVGKMSTGVSLNRKNVCKTIAIKSQLQLCYRFMCDEVFEETSYKRGNFKLLSVDDIQNLKTIYSCAFFNIKCEDSLKDLFSLECRGRRIQKDTVLMIPSDIIHNIFIVEKLLENETGIIFIISKNVTQISVYDQHLQAYLLDIEKINNINFECLTNDDLKCAQVSFITKGFSNENMYIPKRWI